MNKEIRKNWKVIGELIGGSLIEADRKNLSSPIFNMKEKATNSLDNSNLSGVLSILSILGLIEIDSQYNVLVKNSLSFFPLKSLSEYLINQKPVVDTSDPERDKRNFLLNFTEGLETIREEYIRDGKIQGKEIHNVDIVNVIIKGRKLTWRGFKDVYLHIYHPKWGKYHLIGLGVREGEHFSTDFAEYIIIKRLKLNKKQFSIDRYYRTEEVSFITISGSHMALTRYNIIGFTLDKLNLDIGKHLEELVKTNNEFEDYSFRWFTIDEINNLLGKKGEKIMESTPQLLSKSESKKIYNIGIIKNKLEWKRVFIILMFIIGSLAIFYLRQFLLLLNFENYLIQNISGLSQILTTILAIFSYKLFEK